MKISKKVIFALASFVILVLQAFGIKVDVPVVNEIVSAGAGILVMLGIVSDTHSTASGNEEKGETDEKGVNAENDEFAETPNDVCSEKEEGTGVEKNTEKVKITEEKSSGESAVE